MGYALLGLAALLGAMIAAHAFVTWSPAVLARRVRIGSGVGCLVGAVYLMTRGGAAYAAALVPAGLWLLSGAQMQWPPAPTPGRSSRVVTDHLDMELDLDTGAVRGVVRIGTYAGREIETLRPVDLADLWVACRFADPASAQVLEAYLDRVHASWRDDMARAGEAGADRGAAEGPMTRAQALGVLGLGPDATEADIRRAHRELILKVHPDSGGSHPLAATVNQAKQVLLGK